MHFLGNIWRGVVDHHALCYPDLRHPDPADVLQLLLQLGLQKRQRQLQIQKARSGDGHVGYDGIGQVGCSGADAGGQSLGYLQGLQTQPLGHGQGGVALNIYCIYDVSTLECGLGSR